VTGYLASIAPVPPAFAKIDAGRRYWHRVATSTTDGIDRITITAACGAVIDVGADTVLSAVVLDGDACPNCERSAT
jgi:hypothetical protein